MRILLATQWFDPEPTFKGLAFARELTRRGHEVEVLTGFPNYLVFYRVIDEGVDVLRVLHGARDIDAIFEAE